MRLPPALRDPWVAGGVALLALLSAGVVLLYRGAPQSVAEARSAGWVAVSPDAYTPRVSRAEERLRFAEGALARGDTAAALGAYEAAAGEALTAGEHAPGEAERGAAAELWARAVLGRATLMLEAAGAPWWRPDDDELLRQALAAVERVAASPVAPATRARAEELAGAIRRKLRPGPLEWLPR